MFDLVSATLDCTSHFVLRLRRSQWGDRDAARRAEDSGVSAGQGHSGCRAPCRWIGHWRLAETAAAGKGRGHIVDQQAETRAGVQILIALVHADNGRKSWQVRRIETRDI